ncbi:uncharacterized protein LOC116195215 [Punica granatum]|uniref:Uncharacterized protein LOC116195215 n=1 Tax=Punica granatum TaxID=22663 RepID=A0A218X3S2_PUNGR|nr:uncharacterized protein LOC116195215 [Punica granatum]OWM78992.1 hypothetical protein CDL15_Pgr003163 [Punica granatum]
MVHSLTPSLKLDVQKPEKTPTRCSSDSSSSKELTFKPSRRRKSVSNIESANLASETPSSEDVEMAKQSLRECLLSFFHLGMKDKLSLALSTLSSFANQTGLSPDQQRKVQALWTHFDDFVSAFETFEEENPNFLMEKLEMDKTVATTEQNLETQDSYKKSMKDLDEEEEGLTRQLEGVKTKKMKLTSDWDALRTEMKEAESKCEIQECKLRSAAAAKMRAEERRNSSVVAWLELKALFT